MNIDNLIEKLINLKSKGVEEIQVIDDNWNDFELEVSSPEEAHEDDKTIGFLVVYPSQEEVEE